jgi:sulfotransferase
VVVDKNRGWLRMIETVHLLDPGFRMVVCIRDLRQIFGSIEAQHAKTRLLDFPDHMAAHSAYARADALFGPDGVIGGPLKSIEFLRDVPDALRQRLCYVSFEALMEKPVETMNTIHRWLGLPAASFDPESLETKSGESDSHYRFKYRHQTRSAIRPPEPRAIPPRIDHEITKNYGWFFEQFYPGQNVQNAVENDRPAQSSASFSDGESNQAPPKKGFLNKIGF